MVKGGIPKYDIKLEIHNKFVLEKRGIENNRRSKYGLLLDRDGVVIKDKHYIKDYKDVELTNGIKTVFKIAEEENISISIITNQSGIERKYFSWEDYMLVTGRMIHLLGSPLMLEIIVANGYKNSVNDGQGWRKPGIGMIDFVQQETQIDKSRMVLVGDRKTDLIAGLNAGLKKVIHIGSGYGDPKIVRNDMDNYMKTNKLPDRIQYVRNAHLLAEMMQKRALWLK